MNDPKTSIKNLLKDNWVASHTSAVTPHVHTGWYDSKSNLIQVTITNPSEGPVDGGQTGYFGLSASGTPAQEWVGYVVFNCWVTKPAISALGLTVNPKKLAFEIREEAKRIVKANYEEISDLQWISWRGGDEVVDDSQSPVVFRWVGEIGYGYLD